MAKLKPCTDCGTAISRRAKVCPHCGLKKPHEPAFIRGMHGVANGMITLGLLSVSLLMLGFCVAGAAGDRHVAGDALEVGKIYILQEWTPQHPPRNLRRVRGDMILPPHTPIKVLRRVEHDGRPWYWTRWIKPRTIGKSEDSEGWIDSAKLAAGVNSLY